VGIVRTDPWPVQVRKKKGGGCGKRGGGRRHSSTEPYKAIASVHYLAKKGRGGFSAEFWGGREGKAA